MMRSRRCTRESAPGGVTAIRGFDTANHAMAPLLFLLTSLAVSPGVIAAPDPAPEILVTPTRATSSIKVDGILDERAWEDASAVEMPVEVLPGENTPAPVDTTCLLTYDEKNLYVAFRARDPRPSEIRAHLSDRDQSTSDDFVGIILDTFNDQRRAYEFFINPLGVQMDRIYNEVSGGTTEDSSWDAIWNSAGRITADGYVVEAAIPFSSLRFPDSKDGQTWGVWVMRGWPRNLYREMAAANWDRRDSCFLCQFPKLEGISNVKPGRDVELVPTLTSQRTGELSDSGDEWQQGSLRVEAGLTARWSPTSNLSLNGTLNPDFSQVEADAAQLDVNKQFAIFYPEKRPFFLEGADFYATPLNVVYTRTVADPSWGLKFSGKAGKQAVAVFGAEDSITNLIFPANQLSQQTSLDQDSLDGVLRFRRDVGDSTTLGFLMTAREGTDYSNEVLGADGRFRLSNVDTVRFQILGSRTRYPDSVAEQFGQETGFFGGRALDLAYTHYDRDWSWWARYRDLDEGFRADMGFIPRVDVREVYAGAERDFWGDSSHWFQRLSFRVTGIHTRDQDGTLTNQYVAGLVSYQGPLNSSASATCKQAEELYAGTTYDLTTGDVSLELRPADPITLEVTSHFGDAIDYDNMRPGRILDVCPAATLELGAHVNLQVDHQYESLDVQGGRLYRANLSQLRIVYQLNVRCFARAIVQYLDLWCDPALYTYPVSENDRSLFTQLLFSYKINPQTVLFVGLSDDRATTDSGSLTHTGRTVFLKMGYAWLP